MRRLLCTRLAPGGRLGARVPPALIARAWAERVLARRASLFAALSPPAVSAPSPPVVSAPSPPLAAPSPAAEIGMNLNLRLELKADQFRNLRCTSQEQQGALSGWSAGFPTITPNPQEAMRTDGSDGQRLQGDVAFGAKR